MSDTDHESLLRRLPPIRRARLWRLYAENGQRYLDLWQDGGRSLLGAKSTGLGTGLKAAVDMGLDRPLPSVWERRLEKEALAAWPAYSRLRLYRSEASALAALARAAGQPRTEAGFELLDSPLLLDPARRVAAGAGVSAAASALSASGGTFGAAGEAAAALLLRPFASYLEPCPALPAALVLLPCPRAFAPSILLFAEASLAERAGPSELLPPLMARAALRSLAELRRYETEAGEALWKHADRRIARHFERRGPYLFPRCAPEAYPSLFAAALEKRLLLSPDFELPSILPGDFDDGELAVLKDL